MDKILLSTLILFTTLASLGHERPGKSDDIDGADRAGNGRRGKIFVSGKEGDGEKTLILAYLNLATYVEACLNSPSCAMDSSDVDTLKSIEAELRVLPADPSRITFTSEAESPGLFQEDGLAHGGPRLGGTGEDRNVSVNRARLYSTDSQGNAEVIDLASSAALLLDEMAHIAEHAFADSREHVRLEKLCDRLRMLLTSSSKN